MMIPGCATRARVARFEWFHRSFLCSKCPYWYGLLNKRMASCIHNHTAWHDDVSGLSGLTSSNWAVPFVCQQHKLWTFPMWVVSSLGSKVMSFCFERLCMPSLVRLEVGWSPSPCPSFTQWYMTGYVGPIGARRRVGQRFFSPHLAAYSSQSFFFNGGETFQPSSCWSRRLINGCK